MTSMAQQQRLDRIIEYWQQNNTDNNTKNWSINKTPPSYSITWERNDGRDRNITLTMRKEMVDLQATVEYFTLKNNVLCEEKKESFVYSVGYHEVSSALCILYNYANRVEGKT